MNQQSFWNDVFTKKGDDHVSWSEQVPSISIEMIEACGTTPESCVVDIGGGRSRLVDHLLEKGLDCVAVLDVSDVALEETRRRLRAASNVPVWIAADVTSDWSLKPMDVWHDRAVFHFLTAPGDRVQYRRRLEQVLKPGGFAIVATFAPDGPAQCSGLPVARYSPGQLASELGPAFTLVESRAHVHQTPWGANQSFQYSRFTRLR
jgi:hypothetical protein